MPVISAARMRYRVCTALCWQAPRFTAKPKCLGGSLVDDPMSGERFAPTSNMRRVEVGQ